MSADHKKMTVSLLETYPHDGCDDVATPRTSVVKTNKDVSKDIDTIMLEESGSETVIPLDN